MNLLSFVSKKKVAMTLMTIVIVGSTPFFIAPRAAHAEGILTFDIPGWIMSALDWVANYSSNISAADTAMSTNSTWVKEYVLDPLAWVMSQKSLQSVTGSVVGFVNGGSNGTGQPQFVQNLQGNLQKVGDTQMTAFLAQFNKRTSGSPFDATIYSSLRTNYLQGTTLAGFWDANKCTLSKSSSDVNAFLAGDWSQGGASAWFALTTQPQNNPYELYYAAQSELGSMVASAQTARSETISWGQGMMSWCGGSSSGSTCAANSDGTCPSSGCVPDDAAATGCSPSGGGINPGDSCTNSDGSPGSIQTPGSVIHDQLAKVLGNGVDKVVAADELSEVLGNIAVSFVSDVLGGSSGGLAGMSKASSNGKPSYLDSYTGEEPTTSTDTTTPVHSKIEKVSKYMRNWKTILTSAETASTSVKGLEDYCVGQKVKAQTLANSNPGLSVPLAVFITTATENIDEANSALKKYITPAINQAKNASPLVIAVMTLVGRIQAEASSTAATDSTENLGSGTANLTAYTTALASVAGADYTAESWKEYRDIVLDNVMTIDNTQKEVDTATDAITSAQEGLEFKAGVTKSSATFSDNTAAKQHLATDITKLQEMPPTAQDVAESTSNARKSSEATLAQTIITDPESPLTITSGDDSASIVDIMTVLSDNAEELKTTCDMDAYLNDYFNKQSGGS